MSLPNCNSGVALLHAGLLSYFRQHNEVDSCDKSAQSSRTASYFLGDLKYRAFDEEAQRDFWDTDSATGTECGDPAQPAYRRYQRFFHSIQDTLSFICVVALVSCAIYLGLDLALSQYGMGMGLTDRIMGRHLPPPPMLRELHFCLASLNREAPGPQTWHLMSSKPHDDCTTEVVTLLASPSEGWKHRLDDDIPFGDNQQLQSDSIRVGKALKGDNLLDQKDLGDNIAEEGMLSQSGSLAFPGAVYNTMQ